MIDIEFFTTRSRTADEPLPWDHIDIGVTKDYLAHECQKAEKGGITDDCRLGKCSQCGVCDFEDIEPKIFKEDNTKNKAFKAKATGGDEFFKKFKIAYSKMGDARFFGHLEMVKIILRAIKRTGIVVKYSQGFHPLPRISFEDPLPTGTESLDEKFYLTLPGYVKAEKFIQSVNSELPEGLILKSCEIDKHQSKGKQNETTDYMISAEDRIFKKDALTQFVAQESVIIAKLSKKGKLKKINLKDIIMEIHAENPNHLMLKIRKVDGKSARPCDIIKKIFNLSEIEIKRVRILKISKNNILSAEAGKTPNV
jgi:radical SAM-linked protein